jgi:hypothetical protein
MGEMCAGTPTALAALLADPARVAEVPADERQAVLDALAVHEGRWPLVRELLTASLAGTMGATLAVNGQPPLVGSEAGPLTQEEAAERYRIRLRKLRFLTRTQRVPPYLQGRNRMVRPAAAVLPGLVSELRGLADQIDAVVPARVVGKLEPHAIRADTLRAVQ